MINILFNIYIFLYFTDSICSRVVKMVSLLYIFFLDNNASDLDPSNQRKSWIFKKRWSTVWDDLVEIFFLIDNGEVGWGQKTAAFLNPQFDALLNNHFIDLFRGLQKIRPCIH